MPITVASVRSNLTYDVRNKIENFAGRDGFMSRADEDQKIWSWETERKPAIIAELSRSLRDAKGPGARVGTRELEAHVLDQAEALWRSVNQPAGSGRAFLSRREVEALEQSAPELGALVRKAWNLSLAQYNAKLEGNAYKGMLKDLYSTPLKTLEDYEELTAEQREQLVEDLDFGSRVHPDLVNVANVDIREVTAPAAKAFCEQMRAYMERNGSMEVEDTEYPLVGPISVTVSYIQLPSGEVVGGQIRFHQNGGANDSHDYEDYYYATEAEARAAGVDPDEDVQWAAYGSFDLDGEPFSYDTYMEWTGW